jgi:hypothetical protein
MIEHEISEGEVPFLLVVRGYALPGLRCERGIRVILANLGAGAPTNQMEFGKRVVETVRSAKEKPLALWLPAEKAEVLIGVFSDWPPTGGPALARRRSEAIDALFAIWPEGSAPMLPTRPEVCRDPPLLGELEFTAGQVAALFFDAWASWRSVLEKSTKIAEKMGRWGEA